MHAFACAPAFEERKRLGNAHADVKPARTQSTCPPLASDVLVLLRVRRTATGRESRQGKWAYQEGRLRGCGYGTGLCYCGARESEHIKRVEGLLVSRHIKSVDRGAVGNTGYGAGVKQ